MSSNQGNLADEKVDHRQQHPCLLWTTCRMQWLARLVVIICGLWWLSFPLLGGGNFGRSLFSGWAGWVFEADPKAGVPSLMLVVPILCAGTVASLFALPSIPTRAPVMFQSCSRVRFSVSHTTVAISVVLLPSVVYVVSIIYRHLHGKNSTFPETLGSIGNSFGMMAVVAFGWLFIPVSKFDPIKSILCLEEPLMTLIHIWAGRVIVIGSVLHGHFHAIRWSLQGESVIAMMIPPFSCWFGKTDYQPKCQNDITECTCYHLSRNFFGLLAGTAFAIIGLSSLERIRRRHYAIFYRIHVTASLLGFLTMLAHYNMAILYTGGGLLYYIATTYPVWIERLRQQPTSIVSVERLGYSGQQPCVILNIQASETALAKFQPGVYCYIKVPSISSVAHPFTINRVPGRKELQVIFRVTGPWTQEFAAKLSLPGPTPPCYVDGFFGPTFRVNQVLRHDFVLIIAGGVGITPYLSLVRELASNNAIPGQSNVPRIVVLHWICRDQQFIQYCRQHYFSNLDSEHGAIEILINIHYTGIDSSAITSNVLEPRAVEVDSSRQVMEHEPFGIPFRPSAFSIGNGIRQNLGRFFVFGCTVWLGWGLIWYCYHNLQDKELVKGRMVVGLLLGLLGIGAGVVANMYYNLTRPYTRHDGDLRNLLGTMEDKDGIASPDFCDFEMVSRVQGSPDSEDHPQEDLQQESVVCEQFGRPNLAMLTSEVMGTISPAIFYCVPSTMEQEIERAARKHTCNVAIYQESFQL